MRKFLLTFCCTLLLAATAAAQISMQSIYPPNADAKKDISAALAKAKAQHKRVLLVFGADWCFDCHVLDYRFHSSEIEPTLDKNFVVVHVDIGQGERNTDIAQKYEIPVNRGVPSIAVVGSSGALLYSTQNGEISPTRRLSPAYILNFLKQWAPPKAG